ncbi:ATP-binding protein [Streptomyces sp. NPDC002276]
MNPSQKFFRRERRSVPAARRFAHAFLAECGLAGAERGGDVLLCVSELATNALVHGVPPGRQFRVFLCYDGHLLRVEVHDSGGRCPARGRGRRRRRGRARAVTRRRAGRQVGRGGTGLGQGGVGGVRMRCHAVRRSGNRGEIGVGRGIRGIVLRA